MTASHQDASHQDTSRISVSAHYTGYVWYKNGLSASEFVTSTGSFANVLLTPVNAFLKAVAGANIDIFLLQRHRVIDHLAHTLIDEQGIEQVVELAAGLSPRGHRFKQYYPHIRYIETDLAGMAQRKRQLLESLDLNDPLHEVAECDILKDGGEDSIQGVLDQLDPTKKTLIITEGLVNYFDLDTIKQVWQRMATGLSQFPRGYYVTDLYPDLVEHPAYRYLKMAQKLVGFFTRGQWPLHYSSNEHIAEGFREDGFNQVDVYNPSDFYSELDLPRIKTPSLVRIIQAQCNPQD